MVLCQIRRELSTHDVYRNYTHTNKNLTPRGTTLTLANAQVRAIHKYYVRKFPHDDQTIRDCNRYPPQNIRRRHGTRRTAVATPFRRQRRQTARYSP